MSLALFRRRRLDISRGQIDPVAVVLEEYRAAYGLLVFRLDALDQRVPVVGATLTGALGFAAGGEPMTRNMVLLGLPLVILWFVRTTVTHVRSVEDLLRRIDQIERTINRRADQALLQFQSSHPSKGTVGGRTASETVEAVLAASALLLGGCLYVGWNALQGQPWLALYAIYVAAIAGVLLVARHRLTRYRYQPRTADDRISRSVGNS
jgi:hypothetical protein